jgi:hypothetical protein
VKLRVVLLAGLTLALGVDVYAKVLGDQSYVAGGDCGGTSCRNPGTDAGYQIAFAIAALMAVVIAWPVIVQRFRQSGGSSDL